MMQDQRVTVVFTIGVFKDTKQNYSEGGGGWEIYVLGDGSINVRDNDFVVKIPQVDGALTAACALVLGGDTKRHIIRSLL